MRALILALLVVVLALIMLNQVSVADDKSVEDYIQMIYDKGAHDAYKRIVALCENYQGFSFDGESYSCSRRLSL